ncbi:MAG TPA: hypothetical protein VFE01_08745 [Terracidiphilus sp.]|nr:hypothetical protein [Terracidiphilus sp.]
MSEKNYDKAYLEALNAARADLGEIQAKFELLKARRERMQAIADSLRPLIEAAPQIIAPNQPVAVASPESQPEAIDPHSFLIQNPVEPIPTAKEQVEDPSPDSLEQRISRVLGMAAVA